MVGVQQLFDQINLYLLVVFCDLRKNILCQFGKSLFTMYLCWKICAHLPALKLSCESFPMPFLRRVGRCFPFAKPSHQRFSASSTWSHKFTESTISERRWWIEINTFPSRINVTWKGSCKDCVHSTCAAYGGPVLALHNKMGRKKAEIYMYIVLIAKKGSSCFFKPEPVSSKAPGAQSLGQMSFLELLHGKIR